MELLIQPASKGIRYDGYDNDFIQCVFEDANVSGRNERYEFRCRPDLECCGRVCCIPQTAAIPLWLMILFIILGLLLLSALLGTLAWSCRKNKKRHKDVDTAKQTRITNRHDQRPVTGYRSYKQHESQEGLSTEHLVHKEKENAYSTPNDIDTQRSTRGNRGYRNPLYTTTTVKVRETYDRTTDDGNEYDKAGTGTDTGTGTGGETIYRSELVTDSNGKKQLNTSGMRRNGYQTTERVPAPRTVPTTYSGPPPSGPYSTRETFEERFEEKYHVEEEKSKSGSESRELL